MYAVSVGYLRSNKEANQCEEKDPFASVDVRDGAEQRGRDELEQREERADRAAEQHRVDRAAAHTRRRVRHADQAPKIVHPVLHQLISVVLFCFVSISFNQLQIQISVFKVKRQACMCINVDVTCSLDAYRSNILGKRGKMSVKASKSSMSETNTTSFCCMLDTAPL